MRNMRDYDYEGMTCIKTKKLNNKLTIRLYDSEIHNDYVIGLDHAVLRKQGQKQPIDSQILITLNTFETMYSKLADWDIF